MTATRALTCSLAPRPPRRPSRWWLAIAAIGAFLLASLTGCSSVVGHGLSGPEPFVGTQLSAEVIQRTGRAPFLGFAAMLDLPATVVADTCLLPLDLALE